jgi:Zn-dependent peptidase ImmA (M78 family)
MPSITVDIAPDVLTWALKQVDGDIVDTSVRSRVQQWVDGIKKPTFNQIEELSKKTRIPLGYFFLKTPPKEDIKLVDFRTIDSLELVNPSRELVDTISDMERICNWLHDYRVEAGFGTCQAVGYMKGKNDPVEIAKLIRKYLEIADNWYTKTKGADDSFSYIRDKINQIGITVMMSGIVRNNTRRVLNVEEFRAFTLIDDVAPLIFINSTDSHGGRLFSLFHELAHVFIGENDLFNDRQQTVARVSAAETLCNGVAAELLVPREGFIREWDNNNTDDIFEKVSSIAKKFHCGSIVIARKALDNDRLSGDVYNKTAKRVIEAYREYKEAKESSGGNFYNTLGSRVDRILVQSICTGLSEGRITYPEAFRLTNTNMKTFPDLANRLGGVSNW